jgi:acyl carrier protein
MEIPSKLKEYLDNRRGSFPLITNPDEPLQLDSLGLVRLVAFLENDLGIRIEDEELIADNFATLRQIGQLLATKTPTAPIGEAKLSITVERIGL